VANETYTAAAIPVAKLYVEAIFKRVGNLKLAQSQGAGIVVRPRRLLLASLARDVQVRTWPLETE
jgi:hypothetical protein